MKEIWKPVVGFEDRYQVSNFGNVRSNDFLIHYNNGKTELRKGKIRNANIIGGYRYFLMVKRTGSKRVSMKASRMVAMAFIPNPENKPCVDHIDTNTMNDSVDNLRWVTHSENNLNPITRERMSQNRIGKKLSEETKRKIGIASRGRKPTQETIEIIRNKARKVLMFDKDGNYISEFRSAYYAEKETKICKSHIFSSCTGNRKSAGGYMWRYADEWDGKPIPPFFCKKPTFRKKPTFPQSWYDKMKNNKEKYRKKVLVYNMDGVFICECASATEAAKLFCSHRASVSRVCNGKLRHTNNYIFRYK